MNILLLNPFTGNIGMTPPLGLRYISGMLKANGFNNVVGIDLHVDSVAAFESEVKKADVIGKTIGCTEAMFQVTQPQPHTVIEKISRERGWLLSYKLSDLEKLGLYPFTLFKTDEWLGRSSLFKTDDWGPEFIEEMKKKIIEDFDKIGWVRHNFTFVNLRRIVEESFKRFAGYIKIELISFLKDFNLAHIKYIFMAVKYKIKSYSKLV